MNKYYALKPLKPLNFVGSEGRDISPPELSDMQKLFLRYQDYATVWYDMQDMGTLFQDAQGTIPVTALGQPVAYQRDKSGGQNHRASLYSSVFPTLEARVNLLENTEFDFDLRPEDMTGDTTYVDFPGYTRGIHFATAEDVSSINLKFNVDEFTDYTLSFLIKMDDGGVPTLHDTYELSVIYIGINGNNSKLTDAVVNPLGNGVYRVSCKPLLPSHSENNVISISKYRLSINRSFTVSALQLEYGDEFTQYQHVRSTTDYDDVGAKRYLKVYKESALTTLTEEPEPAKLAVESATLVAGMMSEQYTMLTSYLDIARGVEAGLFMLTYPSAGTPTLSTGLGGSLKSITNAGETEKFSKVNTLVNLQFQPTTLQTIVGNTVYVNNEEVGTGTLWHDGLWFYRTREGVLPFNGRDYGFAMVGTLLPALDQGILLNWSKNNLTDA